MGSFPPDRTPCDTPALLTGERRVFVYGTLRAGGRNDIRSLTPAPRFLACAKVQGRLYDLGAYPGLVLGEGAWVRGEVYAVLPELEAVLDEIEEVWPQSTGEYRKRVVSVVGTGKGTTPRSDRAHWSCMLYELDASRAEGRPLIASGDWLAFLQSASAR